MNEVYIKTQDDGEFQLWWLSFADPERPAGTQFLGVVLIEAFDFPGAVIQVHLKDCNPGGEVKGVPVPERVAALVPDHFKGRLLDKEAAQALDQILKQRLKETTQ